jgi:hypothetical protein
VATSIEVGMGVMLQRWRAALVLSTLWGIIWSLGGTAVGFYRARTDHMFLHSIRSWGDVVQVVFLHAAAWGLVGAIQGLAFAGVLTVLGRRVGAAGLRAWRVAAWGALAGLILPAGLLLYMLGYESRRGGGAPPFNAYVVLLGGGAGLGLLCALGTFLLADGTRRSSAGRGGAPAT